VGCVGRLRLRQLGDRAGLSSRASREGPMGTAHEVELHVLARPLDAAGSPIVQAKGWRPLLTERRQLCERGARHR
jgi:hypothetical protein